MPLQWRQSTTRLGHSFMSLIRLTCLITLLLALAGGTPTLAQSSIELTSLKVELWPEYDQPAMLVILDGVLKPEVALPATVTINIPARVGAPAAVAMMDDTGRLLTAETTSQTKGDILAVTLTTQYRTFRVEYYDPALTFNASTRAFSFNWLTDYAVEAVTFKVQEPVGASNLTFTPALTAIGPADFGLNYYTGSLGSLTPGQAVTLQMNYTKADSRLSAEVVNPSSAPATGEAAPVATTPTPAATSATLPIVLGFAGGAFLAGGGLYYWFSRRPPVRGASAKNKNRGHKHARREKAPAAPRPHRQAEAQGALAQFCTECGAKILAGDAFCRKCGAKVRERAAP